MGKPVDPTPKRLGQPTATKQPTSMSKRIVPSWRRCSSIPVAKETSRSSSKAAKPPLGTEVAEASDSRSSIGLSGMLKNARVYPQAGSSSLSTGSGQAPLQRRFCGGIRELTLGAGRGIFVHLVRMPFQSPSAWRRSALSRVLRRAERPPSLSNQRKPGWEAT